jgi:hypothetical protein
VAPNQRVHPVNNNREYAVFYHPNTFAQDQDSRSAAEEGAPTLVSLKRLAI